MSKLKNTGRTFKGCRIFMEDGNELDLKHFRILIEYFCENKNSNYAFSMPYTPSESHVESENKWLKNHPNPREVRTT